MAEPKAPSPEKQVLFSRPETLFSAYLARCRDSTLGSLVKGVVHNLNGSLQILSLHMELLQRSLMQERTPPVSMIQEKVAQCLGQMDKLRALIDGLMQRGLREEQEGPVPVHLNQLLEEELSLLYHNLFFKHHIKTIKSFAHPLPALKGHYGDFSLALGNLLVNAMEAMEKSPTKELEIRTAAGNKGVVVGIRDTGCGIAEEMKPNLFQPFCTNKGRNHYGLGLFLAEELLRPYGASFSYTSKPGETVFTVIFPLPDRY